MSFTLWNVSRKAQSSGAPRAPLEAVGCGKEKKDWGMTLTPPLSRRETARRRAHCLLDEKPKAGRESEVEDV